MGDAQELIEKIAVQFMVMMKHAAPGFICVAAGNVNGPRYLARVKHSANDPAPREDRQWLRDQLGDGDLALQMFYGIYDGVLLFEPVIPRLKKLTGPDGGFRYFPLAELRTRSRERIVEIDPESPLADTALAFAEIPLSSNLLCVRRMEDGQVGVVQVNHDAPPGGFNTGDTVEQLLFEIWAEPAQFLVLSGCYTRYSDGKTDEQWIPIEYVPDARKVTAREVKKQPLPEWWP